MYICALMAVPEAVTANLCQIAERNSLAICVEVISQIRHFSTEYYLDLKCLNMSSPKFLVVQKEHIKID
jgi:hypothetical protein